MDSRRVDGRGAALADRQVDDALAHVLGAVRVAVLDGDVDRAVRDALERELAGGAGGDVLRGAADDLRDGEGAPIDCANHPMMPLRMRLPAAAERLSIVRKIKT